MKTNKFLCLCIAAGMTLTIQAQKLAHPLVGVWQMQRTQPQEGKIYIRPQLGWKIFSKDGSFCTFTVMSQDGSTYLTNEGTYTITSDSTYTEFIQDTGTDPEIQGKNSQIKYRIIGNDLLSISYRLPGKNADGHEWWKRVKTGKPTPATKL